MTKVLFTADWHLKLGQKNVPIEWSKNRFKKLFEQVHALERLVDFHIIGGDIFDKTPSMEELELFYDFVHGCTVRTYIYDGNHEATKKGKTFFSNLKKSVSWINPIVSIIDEFHSLDNIDFIPYCKLKEYNSNDINFHGNILCTHVRGEIPPHVKSEVSLEIFERWDVVLAGDLHSYDNCQLNILYPGSPVTTSFHRNSVDTGAIILDTETLKHTWQKFRLPQLVRRTVKAGDDMPPGDYDHVIYEVEGNLAELGTVKDSELIDKKVLKRITDTTLILDPEMSIEVELDEYLTYILQLSEETRQEIFKEFTPYAKTFHSL